MATLRKMARRIKANEKPLGVDVNHRKFFTLPRRLRREILQRAKKARHE